MAQNYVPHSDYEALLMAKELAAKYSDSPDLKNFFVRYLKNYSAFKSSPFVNDAYLNDLRSKSLSVLPLQVIDDIVNHDHNQDQGEKLKDSKIKKVKGLFGSIAKKYNYILTDLPSEIICDIVSLPGVNKKAIVGLDGPFGDFAKNPSDVIVTLKGALETQNLKSEPIHFTELRQLNGVFISAINLKDDAPDYDLEIPREPRVLLTPEALQTIRLAFQGCYKELHICAPLPQELLREVFQEFPDHIPAKLIHIKASKDSIGGLACFKAAFIEFLKGLFFQKREERLNFKYTGRFDQAAEDLLIEAFHQERLAKICYNGVLGVTQLGRFLNILNFSPTYERTIFECRTNYNVKGFTKFMKGVKATHQTGNKYEILKRDLRIHIELIKNHVTIAILRREDAPQQQNAEKSECEGDEKQVPDCLVLN